MRDLFVSTNPDCASLHPGYACQSAYALSLSGSVQETECCDQGRHPGGNLGLIQLSQLR
jgi:hypothetical protein